MGFDFEFAVEIEDGAFCAGVVVPDDKITVDTIAPNRKVVVVTGNECVASDSTLRARPGVAVESGL